MTGEQCFGRSCQPHGHQHGHPAVDLGGWGRRRRRSGKEKERYAQPTSSSERKRFISTAIMLVPQQVALTVQWVYINREKIPRTNLDSNQKPSKHYSTSLSSLSDPTP